MIYLGNNKIGSIYIGENKIDKIYKGEELVYSSGLPSYYVLATDDDFSGTVDGRFKYIGSDEYIILPKIIKGITITKMGYTWWNGSWYQEEGMFKSNRIIKGVATQEGHSIINMSYMFKYCNTTELDLSYLDASNVTNMKNIFQDSKITTVYCRTQEDANKFNSSSNKPSGLTFVVK